MSDIDRSKFELQAAVHLAVSDFVRATGYRPLLTVRYHEPELTHKDRMDLNTNHPLIDVNINL